MAKIVSGVVAYIQRDKRPMFLGEVLAVERIDGPYAGYNSYPAGKKDGEPTRRAVVREVREETGFDVIYLDQLGRLDFWDDRFKPRSEKNSEAIRYEADVVRCRIVGGELKAGDDAKRAFWISEPEVLGNMFAFPVRKFYEQLYHDRTHTNKTYTYVNLL